tara:strand:+ start:82 stop:2964 length:2883 start_codon:yes stop_codon:yes gene_type:complete
MGTYEKPELLQANQTGGFVKGISEGLAAIGKGFELRGKNQRATKDKEKAKAIKELQKKNKFTDELFVTFGQNSWNKEKGNWSINDDGTWEKGDIDLGLSIDDKYNTFIPSLLKDLHMNYGNTDSDEYRLRKGQVEIMAEKSANLMGYFTKYGAQIDEMFPVDPTTGVRKRLSDNVNGGNMATNNPLDFDAIVDFQVDNGEHGNFFADQDGKTFGWEYIYPKNKDTEEKITWAEFDRLSDDEKKNYTQGIHRIIANDIDKKISNGAHIINVVNRESHDELMKDQWGKWGKSIYDKGVKGEEVERTYTSGGKDYTETVISYEKANTAILNNYMQQVMNIPLDQNTWQSLGFEGVFNPNDQQQRILAVEKMAENAIAQYGKVDEIQNTTKANQRNITQMRVESYKTNNLPGLPSNFSSSTGVDPNNNPIIKDYSTRLTQPISKTGPNGETYAFGSVGADKAGYVYEDYAYIAETLGSDPYNHDALGDLAGILTLMTPQRGYSYYTGNELMQNLWEDNQTEYAAAVDAWNNDPANAGNQIPQSAVAGALVQGSNFFEWLSGSNEDFSATSPVVGAGGLDVNGFYGDSGNYVKEFPISGASSALNLLLNESNITRSSATDLIAGFNSGPAPSGSSGTSSQGSAGVLKSFDFTTNAPGVGITAGEEVNITYYNADGKSEIMKVKPGADIIPMSGQPIDNYTKYANFENTKGYGDGSAMSNYGFNNATVLKEFQDAGGDAKAYKETIEKFYQNGINGKDPNGRGSTFTDLGLDTQEKQDQFFNNLNEDIKASLNDWKVNTGRNVKQLGLVSVLLQEDNKKSEAFMKKFGLDKTDVEKMINASKKGDFELKINDPANPGSKIKVDALDLWTDLNNDEGYFEDKGYKDGSGNAITTAEYVEKIKEDPANASDYTKVGDNFNWSLKKLSSDDIKKAKHAIMGSDFASPDKSKQKAYHKKYLNSWQYRINL